MPVERGALRESLAADVTLEVPLPEVDGVDVLFQVRLGLEGLAADVAPLFVLLRGTTGHDALHTAQLARRSECKLLGQLLFRGRSQHSL